MPESPAIETFTLGPWQTNCYVVHEPGSKTCWVADVSFEPAPLIEHVRRIGTPEAIVLTHAHLDHIGGVSEFLRAFPKTPVWIHQDEARWLSDAELNMSAMIGMPVTCPGPDRTLQHGESITLGGQAWEVRHTPGHSPGGIALVHVPSKRAITGDALFAGSIGRTDFPNADFQTLARSIRTQLYTLPDEVTIYPGHGPRSSIGHEKRTNPFVRDEA